MGAVYLGFDPDLEREVAVKVLTGAVCGDPAALTRFRSEAQAAGNLNHPNVVSVYEIGDDQGFPYIVMEYVPNGSVIDLLRRESPLDLVEATRIIIDASRGIAAAHAKGLIHRDIKPGNLMVSSDRTIKVADFGLARAHNRSADANVTQEGQILGTPHFMSPEQCRGDSLDTRSDLYALGATYFMLLAGVSPFHHAGSTMAILAAHINEAPPDPKQLNPNVPAPCVRIIHRLLAKAPDHRYDSAELLLPDLEALLKVVEDPNTATEVRYRGSAQIPREAFDLPSEVSGSMSRQVDPGGTVSTKLAARGDDSAAGSSKAAFLVRATGQIARTTSRVNVIAPAIIIPAIIVAIETNPTSRCVPDGRCSCKSTGCCVEPKEVGGRRLSEGSLLGQTRSLYPLVARKDHRVGGGRGAGVAGDDGQENASDCRREVFRCG